MTICLFETLATFTRQLPAQRNDYSQKIIGSLQKEAFRSAE